MYLSFYIALSVNLTEIVVTLRLVSMFLLHAFFLGMSSAMLVDFCIILTDILP